MTLTIRTALPEDLPTLVEIERDSFPSPHWTKNDFARYICLVAELDGKVAGLLVARQTAPASKDGRAEREILNIAVAPPFRRSGVATALLKRELEHEADHFLEVRETNAPAQQLYRKFGFAEVGRRSDYYQSPEEAAIVMSRKR